MKAPTTTETDPFDRVYAYWAGQATSKRLDPPSRERWDAIVLRLILSEDPDRKRRYSNIEDKGPESLGADAYELWQKMPDYTPNLSVSRGDFAAHEEALRGSMRRLMQAQGLQERYDDIIEAQKGHERALKARVKRAQTGVVLIGCMAMSLLAFMVLTVMLIIFLRYSG